MVQGVEILHFPLTLAIAVITSCTTMRDVCVGLLQLLMFGNQSVPCMLAEYVLTQWQVFTSGQRDPHGLARRIASLSKDLIIISNKAIVVIITIISINQQYKNN